MADTPVFQGHHVIEQQALRDSELLRELSKRGLFDLDGPRNMLNLPANQQLAAKLGVSPHTGGPLGDYTKELRRELNELQSTADGQTALRNDVDAAERVAAAKRVAAKVGVLDDTLKAGLINGDLATNAPDGMTREQTNQQIKKFFGDIDGYRAQHATQIADLGKMSADEARWAAVTQSESNIETALKAIDPPGLKAAKGDALEAKQSLGTAIEEANTAGRLPLSETGAATVREVFPEVKLEITTPHVSTTPELPPAEGEAALGLGQSKALKVVGAAGVALMAYDFATTGHKVVQLQAQGNATGAESVSTHFIGRNAGGMIAGFGTGFLYGAAGGSETGPGAILTGLAGGAVGAYLGEKWAEQKDIDRIYTQTDHDGNEWTRNPKDPQGAWTRMVETPTTAGGYQQTMLIAVGTLSNQLNYQAANASYELGLANPSKPQDPYSIAPNAKEKSSSDSSGDWVRNPDNKQWTRQVSSLVQTARDDFQSYRTETAAPQRAAELEQEATRVVAQNAANTPAAVAARYQIAYNQFGWSALGPVPEAIGNASTKTQELQASDGNTYSRGPNGQWNTPGMIYGTNPAAGNTLDELNRTWLSQQRGLRDMSALAAQAQANPIPPEQNGLRSQVAQAYGLAGAHPSEAQIDAATTAVAHGQARDDIGQSPFSLQVKPDGSIVTLIGHDDHDLEIKSVTTAAEISQEQRRQAPPPEMQQPDRRAPGPGSHKPDAPAPETAHSQHSTPPQHPATHHHPAPPQHPVIHHHPAIPVHPATDHHPKVDPVYLQEVKRDHGFLQEGRVSELAAAPATASAAPVTPAAAPMAESSATPAPALETTRGTSAPAITQASSTQSPQREPDGVERNSELARVACTSELNANLPAAPEQISPPRQDPLVEQYVVALQTGDEHGARAASMAFVASERGQQMVAEAEQRVLAKQQQLPGRDNPLFAQAMTHLERLGPQAGGYLDRAQMEGVAGAVAYQAKLQHLPSIDSLTPVRDGQSLLATSNNSNSVFLAKDVVIDKTQAAMQPLNQSLRQLTTETQKQQDQVALQAQQRPLDTPQTGFSR